MPIKQPIYIIHFKSQADLEPLPGIYIRSIEDALRANAYDCKVLREAILDLSSALALAQNLAAKCPKGEKQ